MVDSKYNTDNYKSLKISTGSTTKSKAKDSGKLRFVPGHP